MSTSYPFKPIVRDGLVLCTDSYNLKSYDGVGTNINSLTTNQLIGTFSNGVGFDGKSLTFDGIDDHVHIGPLDIGTVGTWEIWVNYDSISGIDVIVGSNSANYYMMYFTSGTFYANYGGPLGGIAYPTGLTVSRWYNILYTRNGNTHEVFINGDSIGTFNISTSSPSIFEILGAESTSQYFFNGKISQFKVYNRILTNVEIRQNYNALKNRFI